MPAAQTDPLHDPAGSRSSATATACGSGRAGSVCLIRSGQDWTETAATRSAGTYLERVEPEPARGMDFLREQGRDVGCLANRYLTVLDDAGRPDRADATGWAGGARWPTWSAGRSRTRRHLAIFGAFMKMAARGSGRTRLRLYHEVSVAEPDEQWFEYVGCRERTGLLDARAHNQ